MSYWYKSAISRHIHGVLIRVYFVQIYNIGSQKIILGENEELHVIEKTIKALEVKL